MNNRPTLSAETLIEKASKDSGYPVSGTSWRQGLDIFLDDFNHSSTVNPIGQAAAQAWVNDALTARFGIEHWLKQHPLVLNQNIKAPVFILGLPRAGTTMLLNLLALDPQHRVYWNWESNREVPPVTRDHYQDDPRIAKKVDEINAALESGFLDERHHVELGNEPCECVWLLGQDFKSYPWVILTYAPHYVTWWMNQANMEEAYHHHKRALQVMQTNVGGQWVLKFPTHAMSIDAILAVYPDAKIIATHRDPIKPLGSSCAASYHLTRQFNDGLDPARVGEQTLDIISCTLKNLCELESRHPKTPVYHLNYDEWVADPLSCIRRLYGFMGEELSQSTQVAMKEELKVHHSRRQKAGKNIYSLEQYGLANNNLPDIFAFYCQKFGIQSLVNK